MPRRALWFGVGAATGCVAAVWGLSSARRASARLSPDRVPEGVADALRGMGRDVRDALSEGREAMELRQRELADEVAARRKRANGHSRTASLR